MVRVKDRNYRITSELLQQYSEGALSNASDLAQEAALLEINGHRARAYFLAVASIEETGKGILAFEGQGRNIANPAVCHRLKLSFEDHQHKIMNAFLPWLMSARDVRNTTKVALSLASDLSIGREPSMYTDIRPDGPLVQFPADVIGKTAAADCVRLANDTLASAKRHVQQRSPSKMSRTEDELFAMKPDSLQKILSTEDFWDYHILQVESGNESFANSVMFYSKNFSAKGIKFKQ